MATEVFTTQSTGQRRYMTTGKTGTGINTYTVTAAARITAATLATYTGATGEFSLGSKTGQRYRGLVLTPTLSIASTAGNYRIYGKRRGQISEVSGAGSVEDFTLSLICYGSFTSSAAGVGVIDTGIVKTTEYVADVLSVTAASGGVSPAGPGSTITAAMGAASPQVYSPGTGAVQINLPAELWLPDIGDYESVIIDGAAAAAVINWIVEAVV